MTRNLLKNRALLTLLTLAVACDRGGPGTGSDGPSSDAVAGLDGGSLDPVSPDASSPDEVPADAAPFHADDAASMNAEIDAEVPSTDGGSDEDAHVAEASIEAGADAAQLPADGGGDLASCLEEPLGTGDVLLTTHTPFYSVQATGERLLTFDGNGRWILRDRITRNVVATGSGVTRASLRGHWLSLQTGGLQGGGLEVRRAQDAALQFSVPISGFAASAIANDGSYVWLATESELSAYDTTTGMQLLAHPGNYARANVVALHGELHVAGGIFDTPAERIPLVGPSNVISFQGTATKFFADGGRFFARDADGTMRVYNLNGTSLGSKPVAFDDQYGGYGDHVWTQHYLNGTRIFRVGSAQPVLTILHPGKADTTPPLHSDSSLVVHEDGGDTTMVDLAAVTPTPRVIAVGLPVLSLAAVGRDLYFATRDEFYSLPEGAATASRRGCGTLLDVALAKSGAFALATGARQILLGDLSTRTVRAVLPGRSEKLSFSRDGSVLAVQDFEANFDLYDTRSGALILHLPGVSATSTTERRLRKYDLSADGSRVLLTRCRFNVDCEDELVDRSGTRIWAQNFTWSADFSAPNSALAPGGTRVARAPDTSVRHASTTTILEGLDTTGSTSGMPLVWLDDNRVLVARYRQGGLYVGMFAVNTQGTDVGMSSFNGSRCTLLRGATLIFSRGDGRIYNATRIDPNDTTHVFSLGQRAILGDANDTQILYFALEESQAGELRVHSY